MHLKKKYIYIQGMIYSTNIINIQESNECFLFYFFEMYEWFIKKFKEVE
jgi:hypothetical protein